MGVGGSYLSQNFNDRHFGLGDNESIERLELLWPSGVRQTFENLEVNQLVEIVESGPQAGLRVVTLPVPPQEPHE